MRQLADGVWQLRGFPPDGINVYLMEDVLVDAGTRHAGRRILRSSRGASVTAHALTHAHPDHQGADEVCGKLGIPFWVGEQDVAWPSSPEGRRGSAAAPQPARDEVLDRPRPPRRPRLREGDEVAGFTVLDVPGHSAGHVAYWRESDRVLVLGDVLNNMNVITGVRGLHEPKVVPHARPGENRRSAEVALERLPLGRPAAARTASSGIGACRLRGTRASSLDFVLRAAGCYQRARAPPIATGPPSTDARAACTSARLCRTTA